MNTVINEDSTTPFIMRGTRDAMADGLSHVEEQVEGIERAVAENPGLAFDLAKTLIESTCRSVLEAREVDYETDDDLPKLFRAVGQSLPFLPPTASQAADVRKSLKQTLSGLSTAIQGICELRNQCGYASHGSGSPRLAMEDAQALLAAQAADTIIGFLYRVHRQDRPPPVAPSFEKNRDFNDYVDDTCEPVIIFDIELKPSEILFQMEPESYWSYLGEFDGGNAETFEFEDDRA